MKKRTIASLIGLAAAGAGAAGGLAAVANAVYAKTMLRFPIDPQREDSLPLQQEGRLWAREAVNFRTVTVNSVDDLILYAWIAPAEQSSHCWAICVHGYRDHHEAMGAFAKLYAERGWNVLMPDQRCHGLSEGDYVGWGYDERLDLIEWINYIVRRDPDAKIVLHGVSMGAATVLMATGGPLPSQVKAAVSDCAYTTIEALMHHAIKFFVQPEGTIPLLLPFKVLFSMLRQVVLRRAGYDLKDVVPVEAVSRSSTPTLFIHGVNDPVVPAKMMGDLYQAARCPKQFLWVPGAGHTECLAILPDLYRSTLDTFLSAYLD